MAGKVRVAFVGAGKMANQVHYPSLASFDDVEIAAICDIDIARMNQTADKYHIERRYTDYRKMADEIAPEGIYVIGPPWVMYDIWIWCLQHKLNLYIEKPLGVTIHQAQALAYLAEKNGCITQVSFQRRCCPLGVMLREEVLKRGPIVHASCTFIKNVPGPYLVAPGQMIYNGVHTLDTLRWLCGGDVVEVQSMTKRVGAPDINFMTSTVLFSTGVVGIMLTSMNVGKRLFGVEMHGTGVSAVADIEAKGYLHIDGEKAAREYDTRQVAGSDQYYVYGGFRAKNREFIDALTTGKQTSSNFADAVKTMELAETILAQALLKGC